MHTQTLTRCHTDWKGKASWKWLRTHFFCIADSLQITIYFFLWPKVGLQNRKDCVLQAVGVETESASWTTAVTCTTHFSTIQLHILLSLMGKGYMEYNQPSIRCAETVILTPRLCHPLSVCHCFFFQAALAAGAPCKLWRLTCPKCVYLCF